MPYRVTDADMRVWFDAWNSHDVARVQEIFADDVTIVEPLVPEPLQGKAGLAGFFGPLFKTYPDIHFAEESYLLSGNEAASWERITGTLAGPTRDLRGRPVASTGRSFDIQGAIRIRWNDAGKIDKVVIYWDRLLLFQQLGLAGEAEPAPDEVTVINAFTLHHPADADRVVGLIREGVETTSSKNPGFVSDRVYRGIDGKVVLNVSTWRGGLATLQQNHAANEASPVYREQLAEVGRYADSQATVYTLAFEHGQNRQRSS